MIRLFSVLILSWGVKGALETTNNTMFNDNKTTLLTTLKNELLNENTSSLTTTENTFGNDSLSSSTTMEIISLNENKTLLSTTIQSSLVNNSSTSLTTETKNITLDENSLSEIALDNDVLVDERITLSSTIEEGILLDDNQTLSTTILKTNSSNNYRESLSAITSNTSTQDTKFSSLTPTNVNTVKSSLLNDDTTSSSTIYKPVLHSNDNQVPISTTMKSTLRDDATPSPPTLSENTSIDEDTQIALNTLKMIFLNGYKASNPLSTVTNINIGTVNLFLNNDMRSSSPTLKDILPGDNSISSYIKSGSANNNLLMSSTAINNNNIMPSYTTLSPVSSSIQSNHLKKFKVYWNVPTFMCHRYGLKFEEVSKKFGMIQNPRDTFRGKEIVILYDPGAFPALVETQNGSIIRNSRVPQKGNIQEHLDAFEKRVNDQVDQNFSGLGVIDFEHWRPVFRQNWAKLDHNRNYSYQIEKERFPSLEEKVVKRLALQEFEIFGQLFMEETIKLAKKFRPKASWGYYGFPYCFNTNFKSKENSQCSEQVKKDNDNIQWLWDQKDVLLPSIYLPFNLTHDQTVGLINGRLNEAQRIANKYNPSPKILPYFWYKYHYSGNNLVKYDDLVLAFQEIMIHDVEGFVLWGSSKDLNSEEKCRGFHDYLNNIFGPLVKKMIDDDSTFTNEDDLVQVFREVKSHDVDGLVIWSQFKDLKSKETCNELYYYLNNTLGPLIKKMIDNDDMFMNIKSFK